MFNVLMLAVPLVPSHRYDGVSMLCVPAAFICLVID